MRTFILIAAVLSATSHTLAETADLHPADSISEAIAHFRKNAPAAYNTIILHAGTYHLDQPLHLTEADNHLTLTAAPNEQVILSGSRPLTLTWTPYKNNILQAQVPPEVKSIDQLFINNQPQHLARYPNFDPTIPIFNGYSPDALSPERVATWSDPTGGFIHALHNGRWGSMHYLITGKNPDGSLAMEGGYQINRPSPMHKQFRFVENIFEELDAPHEFFFNPKTHTLYFYPPKEVDLPHATVEINNLETLIEIHGSGGGDDNKNSAAHITVDGITFTHTNRTFMQTKEPILRSDWCIARTAALLLENTANITIQNCTFENLGGNAIFLSNYNKDATISTCHIHDIGASAIVFLGDPKSVRDPLFNYKATPNLTTPDLTPGPLTQNFPQDCVVTNCLIHNIGQIEKQSAGVNIDIAARITVSHCSIYDTPRAGINIGDGCFGGHLISFNDVFDTVLETSDHGAFNSWGRDRFWTPDRKQINQRVAANPALPLLDVIQPNTLTNNRFRCDHGWDLDLDDGSSNYLIQNNLCLAGGLKLREGYDRHADNNILLNNTLFAHVWLDHSQDTCTHNILMRSYRPTGMPKNGADWGSTIDNNFFTQPAALEKAHDLGLDPHSTAGDPHFLAPQSSNFNVPENSPALAVGFKNFPMDQFGVTDPTLRKLARAPIIPRLTTNDEIPNPRETPTFWLGARVKPITTDAEVSAAGLPDKRGILLLDLPADSAAAKFGLQKLDVVLQTDQSPATNPATLPTSPKSLLIFRNQSEMKLEPK